MLVVLFRRHREVASRDRGHLKGETVSSRSVPNSAIVMILKSVRESYVVALVVRCIRQDMSFKVAA